MSFCVLVTAQQTTIYTSHLVEYERGLELFDKQKYVAAQSYFDKVVKGAENPNSEVTVNAEYYASLCALELFHKDSEYRFRQFVQNHPESHKVKLAYFELGRYNFRKRKWPKVIAWFDKIEIYDLTNEQWPEYYFKLGYSYFMQDDHENASNALFEIKDVDTKYTAPANYYYAHIMYERGDNQSALVGFQKLEGHPKFAPVVPYYIAQIYYKQGKYDELLAYAPPLLGSNNTKRAPEIARLIGESYYHTERFAASVPFLEKYKDQSYGRTPEDEYQLGFAYYRSGDHDKAIKVFESLSTYDTEMAQTSLYHLADCYMKQGKRSHAQSAFLLASKYDFDNEIQEDAMFSYPEVKIGFSGGLISTLACRIPHKIAMDLLLTGDPITAQRAYEMNSRVVKTADEMLSTTSQMR